MVSITFYGGVGEVGGNKIFIKDGDTRISLDFGMQMGKANGIWSEFQQPRRLNAIGDLFEFDLLPQVSGIYRKDYTKHMMWKDDWLEPDSLDAVVLSHAHIDHCEYIRYLRPSIPVYCSPESKLIMQGFDVMSSAEYLESKESFVMYENQKGGLGYTSASSKERVPTFRTFVPIENHKKFKIGSMEFEPIHIDHSLPGTYAFLIHTSSGTIGYTADIRFHGSHPERSLDFVKTAKAAGVDLLLCEGTRLQKDGKPRLADTESMVQELVTKRLQECSGLAVCGYPLRDLDRFMSFYNAIKNTDRRIAIDMRQAYTLGLFDQDPACKGMYPPPDDENLAIFIPRKKSGLVGRTDNPNLHKLVIRDYNPSTHDIQKDDFRDDVHNLMLRDYDLWARDMVDKTNAVNFQTLQGQQNSFALFLTDFALVNLVDVRPVDGSTYIRSQTEPFNEEMALDHRKVKRWLVHFGLIPSAPNPEDIGVWDPIHVSGHGDSAQLASMVSEIAPKRLIPIHTETAELFEELHDSVSHVGLGHTFEM